MRAQELTSNKFRQFVENLEANFPDRRFNISRMLQLGRSEDLWTSYHFLQTLQTSRSRLDLAPCHLRWPANPSAIGMLAETATRFTMLWEIAIATHQAA